MPLEFGYKNICLRNKNITTTILLHFAEDLLLKRKACKSVDG